MKIGVLLSGSGVYDGSEIQEAVFTLLAIEEIGAEAVCISVNKKQHHVINHLTGEEMDESRNMLIESARIARGDVRDISKIDPVDVDALIIPGGFGAAKNFTTWAFNGADGSILPEIKLFLINLINIGKPIAALCVSPVVLSKALQDSGIHPKMTIGTDKDKSSYDIQAFSDGMQQCGTNTVMKSIKEINVDTSNKIITAPCYMMDASILEVRKNIRSAVEALGDLV